MRILPALLLLTCARPSAHMQVPDPVRPELRLPPDTLVYREHLSGSGAERTGNWWARIDTEGCYTEAHNSWMWVTDPVLRASSAWTLHWNGSPPLEPWFCLSLTQRRRLERAVRAVEPWGGSSLDRGPVDRWTTVIDGRITTLILSDPARPGGYAPLLLTLAQIAEEGVWGLSPEPPEPVVGMADAVHP